MELIAGKYKVIRELGEGATGKVFLVEHTELGMQCALKLLAAGMTADERLIERFKAEASVLLRFTHPGSVQMRDFGRTAEGRYYMTMDFCDGDSLKDRVQKLGRFEVGAALELTEQILSVLEAAHKTGIIHRDIKPDNIMVLADAAGKDQIRIMDFGVAKICDLAMTDTKTVDGATIGTPQYMSPEQAAGERNLDFRVDLYSTGIVLYELLTGELPFQGETILQTMLMQLTKPPKEFNPALNLPDFVQEIVLTALQKDRAKRYRSAAEFGEACAAARKRLAGGDSAPAAVETAATPPAEAEVSADGGGKQILCLDDDPMILHIIKHILEREGYMVHTASDASVIHGYIFSRNVDLMICDVQMPGLPGSKVCKMLKEAKPSLKIVLFSNIDERQLSKISAESKANDWISKHAAPNEWLKKIKAVIGE